MTQTTTAIQNLLVIDSQVTDWQSLAAGAGADTFVLILDSGTDGLTQISDYLSNASTQSLSLLQSIQIISHGSEGSLQLGSSTITKSNLDLYTKQLAKIGSSLTDTGDILLYGCNVGAGQAGLDFINQFAALTNADVAASNDVTGSVALGGDWQLEAVTGNIEATVIKANISTVLGYTVTPTTNLTSLPSGWSGTPLTDVIYGTQNDDVMSVNLIGDFIGAYGTYNFAAIANATINLGDGADTLTARSTMGGVGGGGNGSITASSVISSVIDMGVGNDVVVIGSGYYGYTYPGVAGGGPNPAGLINSIIDLGDGDDQITLEGGFSSSTIIGGNGVDTLNVLGYSTGFDYSLGQDFFISQKYAGSSGMNVQGVEIIKFLDKTVLNSSQVIVPVIGSNDAASMVSINGYARVGNKLVANILNLNDPNGVDLASITYQWKSNNTNLEGQTTSEYIVKQNISNLSVEIYYKDGLGAQRTLSSIVLPVYVNLDSTLDEYNSKIVNNIDGGYFVVWQSTKTVNESGYIRNYGDIFLKKFDSNNNPISEDTLVNLDLTGDQHAPDVCVLNNGNIVVCWQSNIDVSLGYSDSKVFYKIFDHNLNPLTGDILASNAFAAYPVITETNSGFNITWMTLFQQGGIVWDIRAKFYDSNGSGLTDEFFVNDIKTDTQSMVSVEKLASGAVVSTWESYNTNSRDIYFKIIDDSGHSITTDILVTNSGYNPSLSAFADNGFVCVWSASVQNNWFVYARQFDSNGFSLSDQIQVASGYNNGQNFVKALTLDNGDYLVAWQDGNSSSYGYSVQIFDRQNNPIIHKASLVTDIKDTNFMFGDWFSKSFSLEHYGTNGFIITYSTPWSGSQDVYSQAYIVENGLLINVGNQNSIIVPLPPEVVLPPIFSNPLSLISTGNEDTQITISLSDISMHSNVADINGQINAYVVKSVSTGRLLIGSSLDTATYWRSGTNDTIDLTHNAYWTADSNANGTLKAFTLIAKDDTGAESAISINAAVNVSAVNDDPQFISYINGGSNSTQGRGQVIGSIILDDESTVVSSYGALYRYDKNGIEDIGFSNNFSSSFFFGYATQIYSITKESDGKILLAGCTHNYTTGNEDFLVLKVDQSGQLDTSFADQGKLLVDFGGYEYAMSIFELADGRFLVGGQTGVLVCIDKNGVIDTSFGNNGKLYPPITAISDIQQKSDGNIVLSGDYVSKVIQISVNGVIDSSFGINGVVDIPSVWHNVYADTMTIQVDNKILVAGHYGDMFDINFSLARLNSDGTLDQNFGNNGVVQIPNTGLGFCLALQNDGKILAGGGQNWGNGNFDIVRLNIDGSLDSTFGNGTGVIVLPTVGVIQSINIDSDGKIMLVGGSNYTIYRLNSDGSIDNTFNGSVLDSFNNSIDVIENAAGVTLNSLAAVYDLELSNITGGVGNFNGSSLIIQRQGLASPDDIFGTTGDLVFDSVSGNIYLGSNNIGTFQNINGQLELLFNNNANQHLVNEALSSITYRNNSDNPSTSVQIDWTFNDGNTGAQGSGVAQSVTGSTIVNITAVNDLPTGTVSISGTPTQGQQLTASNNLVDADGMGTVTYTWYASGSAVSIGTGSTFTLTQDQVGKTITAVASYTDLLGTAESVSSSVTGTVANLNDLPTGTVSISGTPTQGQQLTASNNLVDADGMGTVTYTWYASGSAVSIGTGSTFTLTQDQVGKTITAVASYTDLLGTAESVSSLITTSIAGLIVTPQTFVSTISNETFTAVTTNDTVSYVNATARVTISLLSSLAQNNVAAGMGRDTLVGITNLIGGVFNDTLTGNVNNNVLSGGAGADTLVGGLGTNTLTGGTGIDTFTVTGTDTITDLGNGGADVLKVSLGATANATVTNAWTATATTTNSGTANLTTNGLAVNLALVTTGTKGFSVTNTGIAATLTGSALVDTLIGGTANDSLIGGMGNDSLAGGLGANTLTGGTGIDTFTVTGNDTIKDLGAGGADILSVALGATVNATVTNAWTATAATTTNSGAANLTTNGLAVNLALVTTGTNGYKVTNTGSAATLTGSALADTLTGGTGTDTLVAGAGNDMLIGKAGNDRLTGGLGADTFWFDTATNATTNKDTITDFVTGTDKLQFSVSVLTALGAIGQFAVADQRFWSSATGLAHDATDRLIYNTTTGALSYDNNGNVAGGAVIIEVLGTATHPALAAIDMWVA